MRSPSCLLYLLGCRCCLHLASEANYYGSAFPTLSWRPAILRNLPFHSPSSLASLSQPSVEGESVLMRSSILSHPAMANEVSVKEKIEGRSWSWESMDAIGTMSEYLAEVINMITHPRDACAQGRSWTKESTITFRVCVNFLFSQLQ